MVKVFMARGVYDTKDMNGRFNQMEKGGRIRFNQMEKGGRICTNWPLTKIYFTQGGLVNPHEHNMYRKKCDTHRPLCAMVACVEQTTGKMPFLVVGSLFFLVLVNDLAPLAWTTCDEPPGQVHMP